MSPPEKLSGFSVIWADDFAGPGGSSARQDLWDIKNQGPTPGNNEVEHYTSQTRNQCLSGNGSLSIMPQKDGNGNWTSARLEGWKSFSCPAGKAMILQANLRSGTFPFNEQAGIWPAFWAMGEDFRSKNVGWPECGEWDIFETAHGAAFTLASLHYGRAPGNQNELSIGGPSARGTFVVEEFNTFALKFDRRFSDWTQEKLEWYINDQLFFTIKGSDVNDPELWGRVCHKQIFPILNVAVGSNFPEVGGPPDGSTTTGLGSGLQVQYVAFYMSN